MRALLIAYVIWGLGLLVCQDVVIAQEVAAPTRKLTLQLMGVALSLDGETVLTCGDRIRIYESATGKLIETHDFQPALQRQLAGMEVGGITRLIRHSPCESDLFATGSDDGFIRMWRIGTEKPILEIKALNSDGKSPMGYFNDLQFSPDGKLLASCSVTYLKGMPSRGELKLWNVESGNEMQSVTLDGESINAIAFSPHGTKLAFAHGTHNRASHSIVEIYDIAAWQSLRTIPFGVGFSQGLSYTADGEHLWIAGGECIPAGEGCITTGHLWKAAEDGSTPAELIAADSRNYFRQIVLSNDGETFMTGTSDMQCRVTSSGAPRWVVPGGIGEVYGATQSTYGDKAAYAQMLQVTILEASTGKLIKRFKIADE